MEAFLKLSEPEVSAKPTGTAFGRLRNTVIQSITQQYVENIPSPAIKKMKPICTLFDIKIYLYIIKILLYFECLVVSTYGPIAYGAAVGLFIFFVYTNYLSNINQQYISLQSDSGVCNTVPIKITSTYYAGEIYLPIK